jgi:hypothetical protein
MMIRIAAITFGVLLSFAANAQTIRLDGYRHPKDGTERILMEFYLKGLVDALVLYNSGATDKLFCVPGKLALTAEQADDILLGWVKRQTKTIPADLPIMIALLGGLEDTFPCAK